MIYAISDGVAIALVTAGGAVLVAAITGTFAFLTGRKTKQAIGTPNGQGTVVQMLEKVIRSQGAHDERFEQLELEFRSLDKRMGALERVHGLEAE